MIHDRVRIVWTWEWAAPLIAALIAAQFVYLIVWVRRRVHARRGDATWGRLVAFSAGLGTVVIALMSPIGANDERLLSLHMISHDLLIWVAVPLLLFGAVPILGSTVRLPAGLRRAAAVLTHPFVAWSISTALLWAWHAPRAYGFALISQTAHGVEHLFFLAAYALFWWPLVVPSWEVGWLRSNAQRTAYLLAGMMQSALLGAIITFHGSILYGEYLHVPGATPAAVLADQHLAGALMWFPGAVVFAVAAAFVIRGQEPRLVPGT